MSGQFERCAHCGRLNIGPMCACRDTPPTDCDCTYSGNRQVLGPRCRERMDDAWEKAVEGQR